MGSDDNYNNGSVNKEGGDEDYNDGGASGGSNDNRNQDKNEPEQCRKLFIGGLDYRTTEDSLKAHFSKWGEIVDVVVMKDPKTRRSRGFGFITYSRSFMVDEAQNARPHKVDGREVEPKRAVPREDIGKPEAGATVRKIFVGGLKEEVEEEDLRSYFKSFGNVSNVVLVTTKDTGKKRGFGFVEFDDYDPVDKVVLSKYHEIQGKRVDVKKALSRTEMANMKGGGGGGGGSHYSGGGGREDSRSGGGRGPPGGRGGGGGGGHSQNPWGGRGGGSEGGNWGGSGGGGWGGGYSTGPWEQPPGGGGGGQWGGGWQGSQPGGGYGGDFGGGYQQQYGGGPMRGGQQYGNRPSPYQGGGGYSAPTGGGGGGGGMGYNRRF
ncbi:heterogeneous nuclear ribonucleoprotein A1, A2/B1 homolog [Folsomia candida]|uniref:heterogeneous nuclear ribonucleoprotein A1, A2/B1 homolog n=1 Tax=Folsomia candida TaxID=158441 RepID=UPI000B902382|nr:heterogeneous nuclear ribonucleoprotein A1, A2/B1 homolog [Folsomia candida]XP_021950867.1 heterogeneous nuclear ribonucleoprotein A1, A2/B1 homolog [Folsomia candida]